MKKTQIIFDLLAYVNTKRKFTANEVASEFGISIRTAHRYLSELDSMGVPLYTEPGWGGGYRVLERRVLPPIIFDEDETMAIFFSFQLLKYYKSLPFEVNINSASRKLFATLPKDVKEQVDNLKDNLIFWTKARDIEAPLLKTLIDASIQKSIIEIEYQSPNRTSKREIYPIGIYANEGLWYAFTYDYGKEDIIRLRVDRILDIRDTTKSYEIPKTTLIECLHNYKIKQPVRLYIELTDKGALLCKNNPFFETVIMYHQDFKGAYIDQTIDYSDIEFVADFFMTIGSDAKVVEPIQMQKLIFQKAKHLVAMYK